VTAVRALNGDGQLSFTGKIGIAYQRQGSGDLVGWGDEGSPVTVTAPNSPWEAPVTVTVPPVGAQPRFYRFRANY
jgi:hypothetical protein